MSLDTAFSDNFVKETWALYSVGIFSVVMRNTARIRRLGIRGFQADDYLILVAVAWYTLLCVSLNQVVSGGGSNLMTDEDKRNLTPEIKAERVRGSKWVFVSEHAMVLTLWCLKFCMLIIYRRITNGLQQQRLINYCAIYVALTFVASELTLFLICRPLSNYWAVPTPDYQCSSYQHYEIIQGCLSILGDIFMLLIAIPILTAVRLPLKQKAILLFLFGLGIFIIVAAILTKVYCLVPSLISYVYMSWYFREATVAMLVTNLPLTWSLLRDIFPALKSWTGGSKTTRPIGYNKSQSRNSRRKLSHPGLHSSSLHLLPFNRLASQEPKASKTSTVNTREDSSTNDNSSVKSLHIRQDVTITVQSENMGPGAFPRGSDDGVQRENTQSTWPENPRDQWVSQSQTMTQVVSTKDPEAAR
ncbi:hypothetical protein AJ80_09145 [Polytolypa hystricis UAMH7299]|uniref:Rhodopsin domain-containing protein n=1 Tax=Polytolypa hystricis (strain UAMH7299) TaxID=1447883 RepID=A0A2B7WMR4_POLH7|nr:hypothetical protein AJ80_09145 [Polytolypa hystricis UAMH7299]